MKDEYPKLVTTYDEYGYKRTMWEDEYGREVSTGDACKQLLSNQLDEPVIETQNRRLLLIKH